LIPEYSFFKFESTITIIQIGAWDGSPPIPHSIDFDRRCGIKKKISINTLYHTKLQLMELVLQPLKSSAHTLPAHPFSAFSKLATQSTNRKRKPNDGHYFKIYEVLEDRQYL